MSLAWGSLVLLILLLPGFLFFVGLALPEQFARETAERSALGQLAAVLSVSFFIHSSLYILLGLGCGGIIPCVAIEYLFSSLKFDSSPGLGAALALQIESFAVWIFSYVSIACLLGTFFGYLTGKMVIRGWLKGLTQHTWIYDLTVKDNFTIAYVLTGVRHEDHVVMYQGFLEAFGLQKDGRFSYVVLRNVMRGYMHLSSQKPSTSPKSQWQPIGASGVLLTDVEGQEVKYRRKDRTYLMIEGEDIANIVFDRLEFDAAAANEDLQALIARVTAEMRADADT
jgi:hypothetical protein